MPAPTTFDGLLHSAIYSYTPDIYTSFTSFCLLFGIMFVLWVCVAIPLILRVPASEEMHAFVCVVGGVFCVLGTAFLPLHHKIDNIIYPKMNEEALEKSRVFYTQWMNDCHQHSCEILLGDGYNLSSMPALSALGLRKYIRVGESEDANIIHISGDDIKPAVHNDVSDFRLLSINKINNRYVGYIKLWNRVDTKKFGIYQIDMPNLLLRFRRTDVKDIEEGQVDLDQLKKDFETSVGK